MLSNRLMSIMLGLMVLQVPLVIVISKNNQRSISPGDTDFAVLTIHRDNNCDSRVLHRTKNVHLTTGDTLTICFTPRSSAYIYIINESAEGTYIAYPQSTDQLSPIDSRQIYTFDIVGEPGLETFTFFITQYPIAHFADAIRRGRLRLSHGQLLHGNGSESFRLPANIASTTDIKSPFESEQRNTRAPLFVDIEDLEIFAKRLVSEEEIGKRSSPGRERVRLNSDLSTIAGSVSKPPRNGAAVSKGATMILEFSYAHNSH
jgi:hypothetical protein